MKQGIYLMQDGDQHYVGMTTNIEKRYSKSYRDEHQVAFAPVDNAADLRNVEKEAIEFCNAFGLHLWNVQNNERRHWR